jgi:quinol monooxygenase YgiN
MSFVVIAKLTAKPETQQQLQELITQTAKASWLEAGLLKYILVKDPNQPHSFVLVEFFNSEADYILHRDSSHLDIFRSQVSELLAGEPEVFRGTPALAQLDPKAGIN